MISKEYIEEELKLDDNHLTSYDRMMLEKVLKDLEILDILKRIIKVRPSEIYEFTLVVRGTDEEEDIIKDWLEKSDD